MVVMKKTIFAKIADIDIRPSVVVVVTYGDSETPPFVRDPRPIRDVRKGPVMIVVKKHRARCWFLSLDRFDRRTIQQVNVQPTIIVIVKQCNAGSRSLQDCALIKRPRLMTELVQPR